MCTNTVGEGAEDYERTDGLVYPSKGMGGFDECTA